MKKTRTLAYVIGAVFLLSLTTLTSNVVAQDDAPSMQELAQEGQIMLDQRDFASAAKAYQKMVELDEDNALGWQRLGYALHLAGDLDAAMKAHKKAADFPESKILGLYNQACVHSLQENSDKAFELLQQSVDAGFRDVGQIVGDGDFDNIRKDPRFDKMVAVIKNDGKPMQDDEKKEEKKEEKKDKVEKKAPNIVGTYQVTSGKKMGVDSAKDRMPATIRVTKDAFEIPNPEGGDGFVMSYEIDASKSPIAVDLKIEEGPAPGAPAKGIIKIDGDKLTLCYHPMGGARPADFESTEDNKCHIFVMKKVAPKLSTEMLKGDWKVVKGTRSGANVAEERLATTIKIEKDKITIPAGPESFVMSYKLNTDKSPAEIDMAILSGPAPEGSEAKGIMKVEDGKVFLCYDAMGGGRPAKFESTEDNQCFLFEMKKVIVD